VRVLLIIAALAACKLPTTATLDPSSVVTGVYTLTATSQSDSCDPPRFVGSVTVPIFADTTGSGSDSTTIEIADQSSSVTAPTIARYSLSSATSYTAEVPASGASFAPCPSGGSFSLDYTLTAASSTALTVTDDETWTIVTACPGTTIDAATVPSASCAASRTLEYKLVAACASPCTIIEDNDFPSCTCPAGTSPSDAGTGFGL
jgi:hypothetical protein